MSNENHVYHRQRERHCRSMAEAAATPGVRRRHEQLAELHAGRAALYQDSAYQSSAPAVQLAAF